MFVAIVYISHPESSPYESHRDTKGYEAFLASTKEEAVTNAEVWARRWETEAKPNNPTPIGAIPAKSEKKYNGPYRIVVGEIKEEVDRFPVVTKEFDEFDCF